MQTYILYTDSAFIDPRWLSNAGGNHDLEVDPDGKVELNGQQLRFKDAPLPPGTKIRVWLNRFFECAKLEDIQERDRQHQLHREADQQAYRDKQNRWRNEADAFNKTIKLPVKWGIGEKLVICGLTEKSWGDGRNKASVYHIVLHEDMTIGRLKRKKGDLLCTTDTGKYSSYSDFKIESSTCIDGNGESYQPKLTCKCCVKIIERINSRGR